MEARPHYIPRKRLGWSSGDEKIISRTLTYQCPPLVAGFFMRGRMGGMSIKLAAI